MLNAEEFAVALNQNFEGVKYDAEKRRGTAYVPTVGRVDFHESGSDPAVVVELTSTKRFKGSTASALRFVNALMAAWADSD